MAIMKRFIVLTIYFLFLAAVSFGTGGFVAKKALENRQSETVSEKVEDNKESADAPIDVPEEKKEDAKEIPDDKLTEIATPAQEADEQKEKNKFSFAILGDTQYFKPGVTGSFQKAVGNIKKLNPDAVFAMGDLVSSCDKKAECEGKFNAWKGVLGELYPKAYMVQGNHDRVGKEDADSAWQEIFSLPTNGPAGFSELAYSFDKGNSHFIILDSEKPKENMINEVQRKWLDNDLNANKKENIFVFFHEPAYPTNSKIDEALDVNPNDRDELWNILASHKVTAVFSGHEHIQARSKIRGIYQFIYGNTQSFNHLAPKPGTSEYSYIGEGFGMVEVNGKDITVKTYGVGGNLLNSFNLSGSK
jgi:predicted phosphodiesterase